MKVEWVHTEEEIAEAAERGRNSLLSRLLDLIDSGEMTPEQSAALDEYLNRNRCPECGQ